MTGRFSNGDERPPWLPAWLLERLGGQRGAYMLGDLNEEYARHVRPRQTRVASDIDGATVIQTRHRRDWTAGVPRTYDVARRFNRVTLGSKA